MTTIDELEATLYEGMHLGRTRSSGRRAPAASGVPVLKSALAGLRAFVAGEPQNTRALRLLSLAEEAMLNYGPAIAALERAMEIEGKRDKRDLKRLVLLRQSGDAWAKLPMNPQQLAQLGEFLREKVETGQAVERSLRWTEAWLTEHGFSSNEIRRIVAAFDERGAYSDMQVYCNVVQG